MFWQRTKSPRRPSRTPPRRTRPVLEELESRVVPYVLTGDAWLHPELITLSLMPDGTIVNGSTTPSDLFARFNLQMGSTGAWQAEILRAAQSWAEVANINFSLVSDDGAVWATGPDQQGDPNHGDIRIGGYNYYSTPLAVAFYPNPDVNFDLAGDIKFNTGKVFGIGHNYDLFTVTAHEIGHALGLAHTPNTRAEMYPYYNGTKPVLNYDDVNGIQAIYGARQADAYDAAASNDSFATASDITATINTTDLTDLVTDLDLTTRTDADYYTFTAPTGTSGTLSVTVQSQGLSLLMPKLEVFDASQSLLDSSTSSSLTGSTLTVSASGISAGQQFYVKVSGADNSPFATGTYALVLNFGTNPDPTVPLPDTETPNGNPLHAGGGQADTGDDGDPPGGDIFHDMPTDGQDLASQDVTQQAAINATSISTAAPVVPTSGATTSSSSGLVQASLALASVSSVALPSISSVPDSSGPVQPATVTDAAPTHEAAFLPGGGTADAGTERAEAKPEQKPVTPAAGQAAPASPETQDQEETPETPPAQTGPAEGQVMAPAIRDVYFTDLAQDPRLEVAPETQEAPAAQDARQDSPLALAGLALAGLALWRGCSASKRPRKMTRLGR
jgi:Matrixin